MKKLKLYGLRDWWLAGLACVLFSAFMLSWAILIILQLAGMK